MEFLDLYIYEMFEGIIGNKKGFFVVQILLGDTPFKK